MRNAIFEVSKDVLSAIRLLRERAERIKGRGREAENRQGLLG